MLHIAVLLSVAVLDDSVLLRIELHVGTSLILTSLSETVSPEVVSSEVASSPDHLERARNMAFSHLGRIRTGQTHRQVLQSL